MYVMRNSIITTNAFTKKVINMSSGDIKCNKAFPQLRLGTTACHMSCT